ncbi:hypothetical protein Esi_0084_0069 [Ectocarpus siliculosus]|uniref:Uncharacterized protein n=1 Tax=Ectocarpus siliculosus TaxID=2880 RepID=D7G7M6_ECTSI|nr:hypothetical protein Esi_0084_0069 [Ectocarpus siliculosus]|eukprot:CBJ27765.1 hypothetical protein Esi_0084_0069 [Ectocarpus siliculosus]
MVGWSTFTTITIVGGSMWRILAFPWCHYVAPLHWRREASF